jgi:phosphatidylglycerophosphate synthase
VGARQVYQATKKVPDLPWNEYVCRPAAAWLVSAVQHSRITPNQLTLASFLVATLSALLLVALPGYWGLVVAVFVFELSYVLDCADGMLARWRGIASTEGHLLDFLMDEIKAFVVLSASAVRLYFERGELAFLLAGLLGLVFLASGVAMTTFERRPEIRLALAQRSSRGAEAEPPSDPSPLPTSEGAEPTVLPSGSWVGRFLFGAAKLLVHYPSYIWIAALSGRLELFFWPYVAVHGAYAARSFAWIVLRFAR